jgi:hypothetical protein
MITAQHRQEIAARRMEVSKRYLAGVYMADIAAELGVDTSTVSRDLAKLRAEWLKTSISNIDQKKADELARLDRLEMEYWDAWERSKQDAETTTLEKMGVMKDEAGMVLGTKVKQVKRIEGQTGNPAFLAGVLACIAKRCQILGLDEPRKMDITSAGKPLKGYTIDANPDLWDEPEDTSPGLPDSTL